MGILMEYCFPFLIHFDPPKICSKFQIAQNIYFLVFPIWVVGTLNFCLLMLVNAKLKFVVHVAANLRKTSQNCSNESISNTWLKEVVFGRFLSSVVAHSNSLCAVTSIKKHKFRVPTTHIGKTKKTSIFGLFCNFDRICGGSKRQKKQKIFVHLFTQGIRVFNGGGDPPPIKA